ncbi:4-hydroxy-2-oxovalerate aldolase [Streptomyces glaucescens]
MNELVRLLDGVTPDIAGVYVVDSYGAMLPADVQTYVSAVRERFEVVGFHGHDNLGMANINSITALQAGATIVDATLDGIGRGSGNAAIESLAGVIKKLEADLFDYQELARLAEYCRENMRPIPEDRTMQVLGAVIGIHSGYFPLVEKLAEEYHTDPARLMEAAVTVRTVRHHPPQDHRRLTVTEPTDGMRLEHVVNGGGPCRPAAVRTWSKAASFHNAYGLTETTVCNLLTDALDPDDCRDAVPLGEPVGDCAYVLRGDVRTGATGAGVRRGELVVTGASVAAGYLTQHGVDPLQNPDGSSGYATGDVVELRDGRLTTWNGWTARSRCAATGSTREKIETAVCRHPDVREAVVVTEPQADGDPANPDTLVCYYQGTADPLTLPPATPPGRRPRPLQDPVGAGTRRRLPQHPEREDRPGRPAHRAAGPHPRRTPPPVRTSGCCTWCARSPESGTHGSTTTSSSWAATPPRPSPWSAA